MPFSARRSTCRRVRFGLAAGASIPAEVISVTAQVEVFETRQGLAVAERDGGLVAEIVACEGESADARDVPGVGQLRHVAVGQSSVRKIDGAGEPPQWRHLLAPARLPPLHGGRSQLVRPAGELALGQLAQLRGLTPEVAAQRPPRSLRGSGTQGVEQGRGGRAALSGQRLFDARQLLADIDRRGGAILLLEGQQAADEGVQHRLVFQTGVDLARPRAGSASALPLERGARRAVGSP